MKLFIFVARCTYLAYLRAPCNVTRLLATLLRRASKFTARLRGSARCQLRTAKEGRAGVEYLN